MKNWKIGPEGFGSVEIPILQVIWVYMTFFLLRKFLGMRFQCSLYDFTMIIAKSSC